MHTRPSKENIQNNPYQLLGLSTSASHEEVRNAYKKLILEYHPDRVRMNNQGFSEEEILKRIALAGEKFKDIQEAYELINSGNYHPSHSAQVRPNDTGAHTHTHVDVPDIAKDAVVIKEARVKIYLPIYVIGKAIDNGFGYGIRITMPELEDKASRFIVLRQKINESLSFGEYQVGVDQKEVDGIIDQHSWYKDGLISFVGYVEILLPLYHLNPRAGESEHRSTPYFSIKKNSQIELGDITAFFVTHNQSWSASASSRINEFIESAKKGQIVNTNDNAQPVILPAKFNYDQPLNSAALIEEALSHYRKEYEISVEYSATHVSILENIKKLQDIHHQNISPKQKLEDIKTTIKEHGGRFKKIFDGMITYYQKLVAEETQQIARIEPSLSATSITAFSHPELNNRIAELQPSISNQPPQLKTSLQIFLASEIHSVQLRIESDQKSKTNVVNKLLGWLNSSNDKPTTEEAVTTEHGNDKIDKLQTILNWLQEQASISGRTLNNVKILIHSICALKRKTDPRKPKSQENFEKTFQIDSKPVLDDNDLKSLNSANDIAWLCQIIDERLQNINTVECKMR